MDIKSWKQGIMSSPRRLAVPIMTHPGIDLIGCRVVDAVTDGEVHFRAIHALTEIYPSAACCTIMDLTLEGYMNIIAILTVGYVLYKKLMS